MKGTRSSSGANILLAGGGHAHVAALRLMGLSPIKDAKVTLVSDVTHATCASMLPGIIAGKYRLEEAVIDLRRLCDFAGADFLLGSISGINLNERYISLDRGATVSFRLLSLNLGSCPSFSNDEGVKEFSWPLKPIEIFLAKLEGFINTHREGETKAFIIVGGGKAGVELACALRESLGTDVIIHLVQAHPRLLDDYHERVAEIAEQVLEAKGIVLHLDEYVTELTRHSVLCESGLEIPSDVIIWAARPEAAVKWLGASGLAVDKQGFLQVYDTLQSISHTYVFGVGELATLQGYEGVRTSRLSIQQGALLYSNLKRWIEGERLKGFAYNRAARDFIFTGLSTSIVQTNHIVVNSRIAGFVRDFLDRRFVAKHSF